MPKHLEGPMHDPAPKNGRILASIAAPFGVYDAEIAWGDSDIN